MDVPGRHTAFSYLRRKSRTIREEVDEEFRIHLEMRVDELRAQGVPLEEARREALRRFGDVDRARKYCQRQDESKQSAVQRALLLQDLGQDVRTSIRGLLRAPILALTILATVGLGIAATTVMFSAIEVAFLRPLPYADPDRLVWIYTDAQPFEYRFSVADYLALEAQQTTFARVAAFTNRTMTFSDGGSADLLQGRAVSWGYFRTLGIVPIVGRDFVEGDAAPGGPGAVIVSHAFWQQRLGGRADAIGRPLRLDGKDYALAGVLPPQVGPLERRQDLFVPVQFETPRRRGPFLYWVVGRLKPGIGHSAAAAELGAIDRRLFPIWKSSYQDERATWSLSDLKARLVGGSRNTAAIALAAAAFVWLIACVNASGLLVARIAGRRRELAVRAALGASRARVLRLLMVESGVLAAVSAAVAFALTPLGLALVRRMGATYIPRTEELALDGSVLVVLATVMLLSLVILGLVPSLYALTAPMGSTLGSEGRSSTGTRAVQRLRRILVGLQFAISTPVLIAAALLIISLNELRHVDLGVERRFVLTGAVRLPGAPYRDQGAVVSYWDELARRLHDTAGVVGVAFADSLPPDGASNINNFDLEDFPTPPGQSQPATPWVAVTPEYFRVLGLTLVQGRLLDTRDAMTDRLEAVIVDRAWARRFFPGANAVGKRFKEGGCASCPWTTVVGIVSDAKYTGLDQPDRGTVYWPLDTGLARFVVLRTAGDPQVVIPAIREVVHGLDPDAPLTSIATMDELLAESLRQPRALSVLVAGFALAALALSMVGIYGVMAYFVQQNRRDIAICLALGGTAAHVQRRVVGHGMAAVAGGIAIGAAIAGVATRLLSTVLFNVSTHDVRTFALVSGFLLAVALVACLVPARRAAALQPAAALREE